MNPLRAIELTIYAVIAAACAWGAWQIQNVRYASLQHDFDTYRVEAAEQRDLATQAARLAEKKNTQRLQEALDEAAQREANHLASADAARAAVTGLRKQLAGYRSSLSTGSPEACRVYAGTVAELFGNCAEEYRAVAEDALRLGNSAITLNASWPE